MKRLASLLLVGLAGTAQGAGFENMMNPLGAFNPSGMSNPFAPNPFSSGPFGSSPFGYGSSPFGIGGPMGLGNPLGIGGPFGLGSPLGLGGLAVPLGLGLMNPLGGGGLGGAMYPAMQVAPNIMSYQHMNQMANPYGGGPFAGNPYLQRGMPNPFSAPAFSPSLPTMPTMPFAVPQQQGGVANMLPPMRQPQQPQAYYAVPYSGMPYPTPAMQQPVPANTPWSTGAVAPASPQQAPAQPPTGFFLPFMTPPAQAPVEAPAPVPSAPTPAAALQNPLMFFPMVPQAGQTAPHIPEPPKAAAPVKNEIHAPTRSGASDVPLDPAAFMQMFMKPAPEPAK